MSESEIERNKPNHINMSGKETISYTVIEDAHTKTDGFGRIAIITTNESDNGTFESITFENVSKF